MMRHVERLLDVLHRYDVARRALVISAVVCVIALAVWIRGYDVGSVATGPDAVQEQSLSDIQEIALDRIEVVEWDKEGIARWFLRCASAEIATVQDAATRAPTRRLIFTQPHLRFEDAHEGPIEIRGDIGETDLPPGPLNTRFHVRDVEISGHVVVMATGGIRIESERAVWDSTREAFWFPDWTVFRKPEMPPLRARDALFFRDRRFVGRQLTTIQDTAQEKEP